MGSDDAFGWLIVLILTAGVIFGAYCLIKTTTASGETDYCYITRNEIFHLYGHRSWREDRYMGIYPTFEEAKAKADLVGCPVK